jgi:hypothetical protein
MRPRPPTPRGVAVTLCSVPTGSKSKATSARQSDDESSSVTGNRGRILEKSPRGVLGTKGARRSSDCESTTRNARRTGRADESQKPKVDRARGLRVTTK